MSDSDVELVRRLFESFQSGSLEAVLALVHEDFVVAVPPSMSAEPDTYEGHDGVRRYVAAFEGQLDDVRFELLEVIDAGDRVITRLRLTGRGATSGIEVEQSAVSVLFVRDGKIARIEPYPDMDSAREGMR
jgi:ketosteroid isomerase-like protein